MKIMLPDSADGGVVVLALPPPPPPPLLLLLLLLPPPPHAARAKRQRENKDEFRRISIGKYKSSYYNKSSNLETLVPADAARGLQCFGKAASRTVGATYFERGLSPLGSTFVFQVLQLSKANLH